MVADPDCWTSTAFEEEVKNCLGMEALNRLETELLPWQLATYCGGGVTWRTVLAGSGMCWRRYTINRALESGGAELSDEALSLLDAFEAVISMTPRTLDFLMLDGDLLFADNRRTIHARTPISSGKASNRLMIRSWIRATLVRNEEHDVIFGRPETLPRPRASLTPPPGAPLPRRPCEPAMR